MDGMGSGQTKLSSSEVEATNQAIVVHAHTISLSDTRQQSKTIMTLELAFQNLQPSKSLHQKCPVHHDNPRTPLPPSAHRSLGSSTSRRSSLPPSIPRLSGQPTVAPLVHLKQDLCQRAGPQCKTSITSKFVAH